MAANYAACFHMEKQAAACGVMTQDFPLVIAHRGASAEAPENTLKAFEVARMQGVQMIELDVRRSSDGVLVLFHDATTERWNGRPQVIQATSWSELQRVQIGGEPIARLDEVCSWARAWGGMLNIEIKQCGIEHEVGAVVAASQLEAQVVVSSFDDRALLGMRRVAPALRRGVLMARRKQVGRRPPAHGWPLRALRYTGAYSWHPHYSMVGLPLLTRLLHGRGYKVYVWTVDDVAVMNRLIRVGVDGIITNRPAVLRDLLAERRRLQMPAPGSEA
ncbi:MAG: glycerophosphodiester phosphodiesterase family protein [Herpetosiphon sp.]